MIHKERLLSRYRKDTPVNRDKIGVSEGTDHTEEVKGGPTTETTETTVKEGEEVEEGDGEEAEGIMVRKGDPG